MNLIVAVDANWGIGCKNELLIRIPSDQKMFRQKTMGGVVILGRKTMDTFPNKSPLKDRENLVLSKNKDYVVNGAKVFHSVDEVLQAVKEYPNECVYVIGGSSIYEQFLPYCDTAYVTRIDHSYEADAFFPNLDSDESWELSEESEEQTYFDIIYTFCTYKRK